MPVQASGAMLRLRLKYANRVIQWFPFQSGGIGIDQVLAERLNLAISRQEQIIPLSPGEAAALSRWYRNLIPDLITATDNRVINRIEQFLEHHTV